jgi:hypothetical protein
MDYMAAGTRKKSSEAENTGKHRTTMNPQNGDIINLKIAEDDPSF